MSDTVPIHIGQCSGLMSDSFRAPLEWCPTGSEGCPSWPGTVSDRDRNTHFTRLFGDFEDWHTEPSELFEAGNQVFALGTYSARAKATGRTFKARFAHVWTLRDGVIVRLQQCADTVQLAKALGKDFSKEQA